ncbi:uncharacterized protein TNCV_950421 [Trichonephila clavipes]|nr:uncharacterized protein TNCV_950421 [Trichonephila clavipes]
MVRSEPEVEKGEPEHRVTCVVSVKKLDNFPRLRLLNLPTIRLEVLFRRPGNIISGRISCSSECLNQMQKEEKSFVKEKKRKTSSKPSQKSDKKLKNNANSSSATAKSRSEYMRECQARKKNIAKYFLNADFNDKQKNSANSSSAASKSPSEYT